MTIAKLLGTNLRTSLSLCILTGQILYYDSITSLSYFSWIAQYPPRCIDVIHIDKILIRIKYLNFQSKTGPRASSRNMISQNANDSTWQIFAQS